MTEKRKTLWEYLVLERKKAKEKPVPAVNFHNELQISVGQHLQIDQLDYRDTDWVVSEVYEWRRTIGIETLFFTDYHFRGLPGKKLRAFDKHKDQRDDECWMLSLHDEFEFDQGFLTVVQDAQGSTFNVDDVSFVRSDGLTDPYKVVVQREGTEDLYRKKVKYWDFVRDTQSEAGQVYTELLFIEQDETTGWFQLWRATKVSLDNIFVI